MSVRVKRFLRNGLMLAVTGPGALVCMILFWLDWHKAFLVTSICAVIFTAIIFYGRLPGDPP